MLQEVEREPSPPSERVDTRTSWWFVAALALALLPLAVAAIGAIRAEWTPVSDDALVEIRARDVLSTDPPLLGLYSSASLTAGTNLNHPGPLEFDLLALPVRLLPAGTGIVVGTTLLNSAAVIGIAVFARRRGGLTLGILATLIAAALCWAMGSAMLVTPWPPHIVILPFLCFLMAMWALSCGDLVAAPWAAFAGSFVVQTHLSLAVLVPTIAVCGLVGLGMKVRDDRRRDPSAWPDARRDLRRFGLITAAVFVVCWIEPLIEQLTSEGAGNVSRIVRSIGHSHEVIGLELGTRVVASVVALPPWWLRPSFADAERASRALGGWQPTTIGVAVVSLLILAAVLAFCALRGGRAHGSRGARAIAIAATSVLAALASASLAPITPVPNHAHLYGWLWPIGAFTVFAVIVAVLSMFEPGAARERVLGGGAMVAILIVVLLNLPSSDQGTIASEQAMKVARDLTDQLDHVGLESPVFLDAHAAFADPYPAAVLAAITRRGLSFVITDDITNKENVGDGRHFDGDNAETVLSLRSADGLLDPPARSERVAYVGLDPPGRRELVSLRDEVARRLLGAGGVRLNARGRAALRRGEYPVFRSLDAEDAAGTIERLTSTRELVKMIEDGSLDVDPPLARLLRRYSVLQRRWDQSVALYVAPLRVWAKAEGKLTTSS